MADEIVLFEMIDELQKKNRELTDQVRELRILGRLARVIAMQEGENADLQVRMLKADRAREEAEMNSTTLRLRVEAAEARIAELDTKQG
jgi:hypothetical protein